MGSSQASGREFGESEAGTGGSSRAVRAIRPLERKTSIAMQHDLD
jgi:hypothetical protein